MRRSNIRGKPPKWFYGPGVACTREFLYRKGFVFIRNARRARAVQRPTTLKKKIRAIQYGVGPIGASIARLMREKFAIEIIGAIDTDPAKVAMTSAKLWVPPMLPGA